MKIWDVLKLENEGKKYKTKIYGIEEILKVGYDKNSSKFLTLKRSKDDIGVEFPLLQLYLGCILEMDFEEVE